MAGLRSRGRRQLAEALSELIAVEGGRAFVRGFQCQAIVLTGQSRLAYLIETDGEIEQVIRVIGIRGDRVEVGLLRFRPAALASIEIAEGEVERCRFRLCAEQAFQPAFGGVRVGCGRCAAKYRRLSGRIVGVGDQCALLQLFGISAAPLAVGDGGQCKECVGVVRVSPQALFVVCASLVEIAALQAGMTTQ